MTVTWSDEVDAVLAGDLTAALGYRTPAGGVVVQAVAPIGLRDRTAGTVGFTTSLGFSKKLERIARDPRVAMAFHAREHGFAGGQDYDAREIQGRARGWWEKPSAEQWLQIRTLAAAHLGPAREGRFWNWWLRQYYAVRVPVHIEVERMVTWPDLRCAGSPRVSGDPLAAAAPDSQPPPEHGTGPRIDVARAARRPRGTRHVLLGFAGADGRPVILPVEVEGVVPGGLRLAAAAPLPLGGRHAGLLGHSYQPHLVGLEARQYTGWLEVGDDDGGLYAPHTETGYKAPANKTLLLLLNGFLAKRGVSEARKRGTD